MAGKSRQGRGRLSKLDMLPEVAQPDLLWLIQELRANKRPQNELLDIFNMRLAAHGIEPISNGSFSRYSVRKSVQFRELDETMRLSNDLVDLLGADSADKMTITLAEMIKVAGVKLIETGGGELAAKDLMELARAVQAATGAQKASAEYRRLLEREFSAKVEEASKAVAKVAGVSPDAMLKIKDILAGIA